MIGVMTNGDNGIVQYIVRLLRETFKQERMKKTQYYYYSFYWLLSVSTSENGTSLKTFTAAFFTVKRIRKLMDVLDKFENNKN